MGVDAEMFVRISEKKHWLSPEQELPEAVRLAQTIGAEEFFIQRRWPDLKGHHALSIIQPTEKGDYSEDEYIGKVVWFQDGPPIIAGPDEQFLRIHLWSRYYGPGYERGNWPTLRATMEYLQVRFPFGKVWYGGDSSGILAEEMTAEKIAEINKLFLRERGRHNYTHYEGPFKRKTATVICPVCQIPTTNTGGGGGCEFQWCDGCNGHFILDRLTGDVFWKEYEKDFFRLHDLVKSKQLKPIFNVD